MQRRRVRSVGMALARQLSALLPQHRRYLHREPRALSIATEVVREARFPEGFYKVGFDLVLNGRNHGCGGDRFGFGESIEQELRTEVVVTMGMGDVNGDEILATLDDPIQQLPRVLRGQKRINEYGITLLMREFAEPDRDWVPDLRFAPIPKASHWVQADRESQRPID